ncbi:hypothetical protein ACLGL1_09280 [Peptococcus simiae]|uniref:hypothetical protein n=1 Tax=Peptococcus simiae TaxID=1643805 RepID=UPI0039818A9A
MDSLLYLWYELVLPLFYTALALAPIFFFYLFMRVLLKVTRRHQGKKPARSKGQLGGFLPATPAKEQKQARRQAEKRQGTKSQGKRAPGPSRPSPGHAKKAQLSDFAQLSKKWHKKAAASSQSSRQKKPDKPSQAVPATSKKAKKEPLQAKKTTISPHKTRLKSRYANRSINIQVENLDSQNRMGHQGLETLDLRKVREGVVWQAILEPPKAIKNKTATD